MHTWVTIEFAHYSKNFGFSRVTRQRLYFRANTDIPGEFYQCICVDFGCRVIPHKDDSQTALNSLLM